MRTKRANEKKIGIKIPDDAKEETEEQYSTRLTKQRVRQQKLRDAETPHQRQAILGLLSF